MPPDKDSSPAKGSFKGNGSSPSLVVVVVLVVASCFSFVWSLSSALTFIDPIQIKLDEVHNVDISSEKMSLAIDMLTGKDEFCVNYLQAYRDGRLQ